MLDLAQVRTLLLAERSRDVAVITEAVDAVLATSPEVSPLDIEMVFRDAGSPVYLISKPELTIVIGMPAWRSALDRLGMFAARKSIRAGVQADHRSLTAAHARGLLACGEYKCAHSVVIVVDASRCGVMTCGSLI